MLLSNAHQAEILETFQVMRRQYHPIQLAPKVLSSSQLKEALSPRFELLKLKQLPQMLGDVMRSTKNFEQLDSSSDEQDCCEYPESSHISPAIVEQGDSANIAGQRVSVIKSILQKMLMQSTQEQQRSETSLEWTLQEIAALTDIFKTVVHRELQPVEEDR